MKISEKRKRELKEYNVTFFPIIKNSHWTLAVALKSEKSIHYWDSLSNPIPEDALNYLTEIFDDYQFVNCSDIRHQQDSVNCALFITYYARYYTINDKKAKNKILSDKRCNSKTMFLIRKIIASKLYPELWKENGNPSSVINSNNTDKPLNSQIEIGPKLGVSSKSTSRKKTSKTRTSQKPLSRKTKKQLTKTAPDSDTPSQQTISVLEALEKLSPQLPPNVKEVLIFGGIHQIKDKWQKKAFQEPLIDGSARILMDFKSNISIGMTCEQETQQYYNLSHRQLLGIWVKTCSRELFFDILSEDLTKDSIFVLNGLKKVFDSDSFKNLKLKHLDIWSDGAKHFRNK
jgi:hypothetical protein